MINAKDNVDDSLVLCLHKTKLFQACLHFCWTLSPVPQENLLLFLSVALPQFVLAPRVLLPATWGRHDHILPFMN